jgi:hypothetical protein
MTNPPLIDEQLAAFLCGPVSINVASRTRDRLPVLVRASGCRVAPDRRRVTVFLARSKSESVLEALRATRAVAAVFSLPSSHRSVQLKGSDAEVAAPAAGDPELVERYIGAFTREIDPLGYRPDMGRALLWLDAGDLVAVSFTPAAAFTQTPGPGAGSPLGRAA